MPLVVQTDQKKRELSNTSLDTASETPKVGSPKFEHVEDERAQEYYDSPSAYNFYKHVWGGDNIHVGLYEGKFTEDVKALSLLPFDEQAMTVKAARSVQNLDGASLIKVAGEKSLANLFTNYVSTVLSKKNCRVMDMGSAYGGCARYVHQQYGAKVSCVDLSVKENEENERINMQMNISEDDIWIDGARSFTETGEDSNSFDMVVSQDTFLHAGQYRREAVKEASRVLKKDGIFVFTDIMEADHIPNKDILAPVYKRINLDDMGSVERYRRWGEENGLRFLKFEDHSAQLRNHYTLVAHTLLYKYYGEQSLFGKVDEGFVTKMLAGLSSWVENARAENLRWGYLHFQKIE